MPILQGSGDTLHINIPKAIATLKGWKKGDVLEFKEHHGDIYLIEVR